MAVIATTASAPASRVECERKPAKCSRIDTSSPASVPSRSPAANMTDALVARATMKLPMIRTIETKTASSDSGKLPHGAGGRSSIDGRPRA